VSQIITYGSMAAKAVVRDVGRVLGHPYGFVDSIAKLIPFELGITLDKALTDDAELRRRYEQEDEVHDLLNLARALEGLPRNAGKHAGGVVIAPTVLTDFAPLYCEAGGESLVTQFDKDDVEAIGLVKFDFLGLKTLTIIDWAVRQINATRLAQGQLPLDISTIPLADTKAFELLKRCKTTAVFQLESRGMKDLIRRLQPDCFEDIIALVALFRPGPLQSGMVDDFIERKHGRAEIIYQHPALEPILKPTYGVIVYQEQVMQIAQVLAGYTLGSADLLRRAMGKKKAEEMAKQRSSFVQGATAREVDAEVAGGIFDLMEKFAGYGFNKSHSAAYALLSYQTAYLKAHYPAEFLAAAMTSAMTDTDAVVVLVGDCRAQGIPIDPPDINQSRINFTAVGGRIRYGLGAIKGVGEAALGNLLQVREQGRFSDLFDLCQRCAGQKINRRVLEALIKAGALDPLEANRAQVMAQLEPALQWASQSERHCLDQGDIFSLSTGGVGQRPSVRLPVAPVTPPWGLEVQLAAEKETLGFYLSGHPCQAHIPLLARVAPQRIGELCRLELRNHKSQKVIAAGLAATIRRHSSAKRGKMAVVLLEDHTGGLEVVLFSEALEQYGALLVEGSLLVIEGALSFDPRNEVNRILADKVHPAAQANAQTIKTLHLDWDGQSDPERVAALRNLLTPHLGGRCGLVVHYQGVAAQVDLQLGDAWRIAPNVDLVQRLSTWAGADKFRVDY
jgi:DNA polymerase-3 subunit alpha